MATITTPIPDGELTAVKVDDRTARGLPLPSPENSMILDAIRMRAALILIDGLLGANADQIRTAVSDAVAPLTAGAPAGLNSFAEVASALGGNANLAADMVTALGGKASTTALAEAIDQLGQAIATRAPRADPVFTGNPTAPTPAIADNDTSIATTAFVQALIATVLNLTGGTLKGALSFDPRTFTVLTGGTTTVPYGEGNRRQYELRSGTNTLNLTGIPVSGGDLELDLLYTAGSLGFTQTINWVIGGGLKSTDIGQTGLTLTAGLRYAVVVWNMGGDLYGAIG